MAPHHHITVKPVERDCLCPKRPPEKHTPACEEAFREKFFGAWADARAAFRRAAG